MGEKLFSSSSPRTRSSDLLQPQQGRMSPWRVIASIVSIIGHKSVRYVHYLHCFHNICKRIAHEILKMRKTANLPQYKRGCNSATPIYGRDERMRSISFRGNQY